MSCGVSSWYSLKNLHWYIFEDVESKILIWSKSWTYTILATLVLLLSWLSRQGRLDKIKNILILAQIEIDEEDFEE